jgi:hypothetical protein
MTPKEKCDELIEQYKPIVTLKMGFEQAYVLVKAKECALIAVDEILLSQFQFDMISIYRTPFNHYWQEVKTEIELL